MNRFWLWFFDMGWIMYWLNWRHVVLREIRPWERNWVIRSLLENFIFLLYWLTGILAHSLMLRIINRIGVWIVVRNSFVSFSNIFAVLCLLMAIYLWEILVRRRKHQRVRIGIGVSISSGVCIPVGMAFHLMSWRLLFGSFFIVFLSFWGSRKCIKPAF